MTCWLMYIFHDFLPIFRQESSPLPLHGVNESCNLTPTIHVLTELCFTSYCPTERVHLYVCMYILTQTEKKEVTKEIICFMEDVAWNQAAV